jgi:hypothetical protein
VWRPDVGRRRPIGEILLEKKSPRAVCGAGFMISLDGATVPVICPTRQIQNLTKRQPRKSDKLKPLSGKIRCRHEKTRCRFAGAGRIISR